MKRFPHVLSATQFTREELDALFARADELKGLRRRDRPRTLAGKMVAIILEEPSTRTRISFETAARYLGASTIVSEAAGMFSSLAKGETPEDMAVVLAGYEIDALVMRHKEIGTSRRVAAVSPIPVINAGDGAGEHPTQALLDLYTILRLRKSDRLTLAFCGDLDHSRTVRSLCRLIIQYGGVPSFELRLVSPFEIRLGEDIRQELGAAGIPFVETEDLNLALREGDFFYQTRVQRERYGDGDEGERMYRAVQSRFALNAGNVQSMKPDAFIMHPLPRGGELSKDVDADRHARYFQQAANGLYVRMALLERVLADG
ncbi:aspartate carbamoyltransferase [Candidatus Uhrbacteria bacterium RIFOXYB12_FULL_58_10]|uniref:Aspartate carbamoyltransferase n=1 Tax=Candidatus Uhrbacteria bacterium RIFOXYB2_FULL_57_15 TaxID=1802422 RepID=A0A1F7W884_9BACT|nr:MAG: aspartate carbamoyltransferase [Candidatus Uhrbacteria bacterium RIFOXYB12_FULL_58_10]OGL98846.1 MAG: aspartate carbamoyltransferase [Candidatus Uhrbacteria bacterium RIFOXYB2_FULL_57_15]OGL98933.1 MAG: aspartate carbamoyltransferase [Candidatus Uhrbacteria bacterium RIFOXYC12_FULL_57_11]